MAMPWWQYRHGGCWHHVHSVHRYWLLLPICSTVRVSVCVLVTIVSPEPIKMPFGVLTCWLKKPCVTEGNISAPPRKYNWIIHAWQRRGLWLIVATSYYRGSIQAGAGKGRRIEPSTQCRQPAVDMIWVPTVTFPAAQKDAPSSYMQGDESTISWPRVWCPHHYIIIPCTMLVLSFTMHKNAHLPRKCPLQM